MPMRVLKITKKMFKKVTYVTPFVCRILICIKHCLRLIHLNYKFASNTYDATCDLWTKLTIIHSHKNCFESWNAAGLQKKDFFLYIFLNTQSALRGKWERDKRSFHWNDDDHSFMIQFRCITALLIKALTGGREDQHFKVDIKCS